MKVVSLPIVEYWMKNCMILRRFERLEKMVYLFLKAQGSNLRASIGRHIFNYCGKWGIEPSGERGKMG